MSGSLGRLASTSSYRTSRHSLIVSSSSYSTFAGGGGGGGGRGRGGGRGSGSGGPCGPSDSSPFAAPTPGKLDTDAEVDDSFFPLGVGHGRGKPLPSSPILPSFSSLKPSASYPAGRGIVRTTQPHPNPPHSESEGFQPKKPIFFSRQDTQKTQLNDSDLKLDEDILRSSLLPALPGAGRGRPPKPSSPSLSDRTGTEENRHLQSSRGGAVNMRDRSSPSPPRLSREDAVKKAVGILSQRRGGDGMGDGGRGRGLRGRGGRGRGRRGSGWRGRGERSSGPFHDADDDYATGLYLGDNADGEKLAQRLGPVNMDKVAELFEHMSYDVLPSPVDDAYLDAVHTNNMIEFEPEYLMGEFDSNPDIDEKPPIPLRDALEKVKPFLMAYEGIQSQEEWEEIIEETMEKVPHMKELIDMYSGPDRVTAKQQQGELERVAQTLPDNIPSSVKRFADRAVLSLQSNPGWGFDKKCQFMDKLVWEVSQQYK